LGKLKKNELLLNYQQHFDSIWISKNQPWRIGIQGFYGLGNATYSER
jgi:hypothetical protein